MLQQTKEDHVVDQRLCTHTCWHVHTWWQAVDFAPKSTSLFLFCTCTKEVYICIMLRRLICVATQNPETCNRSLNHTFYICTFYMCTYVSCTFHICLIVSEGKRIVKSLLYILSYIVAERIPVYQSPVCNELEFEKKKFSFFCHLSLRYFNASLKLLFFKFAFSRKKSSFSYFSISLKASISNFFHCFFLKRLHISCACEWTNEKLLERMYLEILFFFCFNFFRRNLWWLSPQWLIVLSVIKCMYYYHSRVMKC